MQCGSSEESFKAILPNVVVRRRQYFVALRGSRTLSFVKKQTEINCDRDQT